MSLVPMVIEKTAGGERAMDIQSRLLRDRIVMLTTGVDEQSAAIIVSQLLFLESEDPKADIHFYINSPGGSVVDGLAIYDVMELIKCDVSTIAMGQICSMGSLLFQSGAAGKRYMMPNARQMIHSVSCGSPSQTIIDQRIRMAETDKLNTQLTQIYANHNSKGKTFADFEMVMQRDFFLSAQESIAFGVADHIITKRP